MGTVRGARMIKGKGWSSVRGELCLARVRPTRGGGAGEKKFYLALEDSHRGKGEEMKDKKGQGYWVWKGHT